MLDQKPDFVHVGGDHHTGTTGAAPAADDVAERVGAHLIDEAGHFVAHQRGNGVLAAGDAGQLAYALQEIKIEIRRVRHIHSLCMPPSWRLWP